MAKIIRSKSPDVCTTCGAGLGPDMRRFVLLPADDVPRTGSRCEVIVNPAACLRVVARCCENGHVALSIAPDDEPG